MKASRLQVRLAAFLCAALLLLGAPALAAVGCALTNPEDDLRSFFPEMTDFSTRYLTFQAQAPERHGLLAKGLGDTLDPVYETSDVPYTLYAARANGKTLGYVFGANQRGTYSNIQVIAVTEADLSLKSVYLQKIRSPLWETFRSEAFSEALSGLSLETYPTLRACYVEGRCDPETVADPTGGKESGDFRAILRALAKLHVLSNLLLEPGVERAGRDAQARSERITSWWHGEPTGRAIVKPRWSSIGSAPWSKDEPVILWRTGPESVIIPLSVLATHPVVNAEVNGRKVAFTWSPYQNTIVVLERPSGLHFEPTTELLHGVMLVTGSDDRTQWSPALAAAVRGIGASRSTTLVAGPVSTSFAQASRVAPSARVLLSDPRDEVETLVRVRERLQARHPTGAQEPRAVVVGVGERRHGFIFPDDRAGLTRARVADKSIALIHQGDFRAAYLEDTSRGLIDLGPDPFSGAPRLWDPSQDTLHEGITGGVLHGPSGARPLEPVAIYGLAADAYRALHPGMPLSAINPR